MGRVEDGNRTRCDPIPLCIWSGLRTKAEVPIVQQSSHWPRLTKYLCCSLLFSPHPCPQTSASQGLLFPSASFSFLYKSSILATSSLDSSLGLFAFLALSSLSPFFLCYSLNLTLSYHSPVQSWLFWIPLAVLFLIIYNKDLLNIKLEQSPWPVGTGQISLTWWHYPSHPCAQTWAIIYTGPLWWLK